jgi:hypothetical protein
MCFVTLVCKLTGPKAEIFWRIIGVMERIIGEIFEKCRIE